MVSSRGRRSPSRPRQVATTVDVRDDVAAVHESETISTWIADLRHRNSESGFFPPGPRTLASSCDSPRATTVRLDPARRSRRIELVSRLWLDCVPSLSRRSEVCGPMRDASTRARPTERWPPRRAEVHDSLRSSLRQQRAAPRMTNAAMAKAGAREGLSTSGTTSDTAGGSGTVGSACSSSSKRACHRGSSIAVASAATRASDRRRSSRIRYAVNIVSAMTARNRVPMSATGHITGSEITEVKTPPPPQR